MKNATKHAERLKSLLRSLMRDNKPAPQPPATPPEPIDPLQALVRAAMSYDVSDTKAEEAMRHIRSEFVDLNELRVATDLEIQELLGTRYPAIEQRVEMITRCLNAIFEKEHTLSLDRLKTLSKRDARQFLRDLPDIHPFVEAYVALYAFDGHAIPVDNLIVEYLQEESVLEAETSLDDAQKFLEHHAKAEECKDIYAALRRAACDEKNRKKQK